MTIWVLLRGLMRESRHWGEFPIRFKEAVACEAVVPLDFPGNGRLHHLKSPSRVTEMVDSVRAQLLDLGHLPPYCVLAQSLGAMVSVAWNERFPGEIEKLVLINTSLAPFNPFYHRLRPENYPGLIWTMLFGSMANRERLILDVTSNLRRLENGQTVLMQWIGYSVQAPVARKNILRQLLAAATFRAKVNKPSIPVLLLASEHDRLVDVKCSHALAKFWDCPILMHPAAGHDLPLDDAEWVLHQCVQWQPRRNR
ncbi:MAG: alpha/beta hydrolase [Gallionella sp.]